jgi:hypothetical protein
MITQRSVPPGVSRAELLAAVRSHAVALELNRIPDPFVGAAGAAPSARSVELALDQDGLVRPNVNARLANEVRVLVLVLGQFGRATKAIGEDLGPDAEFGKLIALFLSLFGFQLANAFGKDLDSSIFVDDGRQYLADLSLSLEQAFREVDLDGRRFLAIALGEQRAPQI